MKQTILLVFLFAFCFRSFSQDTVPNVFKCRTSVSLELKASSDEVFGFAFDRILSKDPRANAGIRVGSSIPYQLNSYLHVIPITGFLLFGKKNDFIEAGFGGEIIYESRNYKTNYGAVIFSFGFRHQNRNGGFFYRAALTPTIGVIGRYPYLGPLLSFSLGWTF